MNKEIWRKLHHPYINDGYYLSTYGRIRYKNNEPYDPTYPSSNGYDYSLFVLKYVNNDIPHHRLFPIDELIGITFIPIPEELKGKLLTIKHINGDTRDIDLSNLEWIEDIEEWRYCTYPSVKPGMYEVSSWGRVRNKITNHIYNTSNTNVYGYHRIRLMSNEINISHEYRIHRLVAWEFCVHDDHFIENHVNHINGNKSFNHYKNLESIPVYENNIHAQLTDLVRKGERHPSSKLSNDTVIKICEMIVKYDGNIYTVYQSLQNMNIDVSYRTLLRIKNKERWGFISDNYFNKDTYRIYPKRLSEQDVINICKLNLKYPKQCKKIKREAEKIGMNVSLSRIKHIVYKISFKEISDKFF